MRPRLSSHGCLLARHRIDLNTRFGVVNRIDHLTMTRFCGQLASKSVGKQRAHDLYRDLPQHHQIGRSLK